MTKTDAWGRPMVPYLPSSVVNDTEAMAILRDALNGKPGWAIRARRVLGIAQQLECVRPGCIVSFPSGGKRKKYCSETCRKVDYKRLAKWPFTEARDDIRSRSHRG